jgi:cob(I)alamin adenosyltransferase
LSSSGPETGKSRLSRIVTRTGDAGTSGLADGSRLSKTHPRMQGLGDIDECNAHIGLLRSVLTQYPVSAADFADLDPFLADQQHALFDLGGYLAMGNLASPGQLPDLAALEAWIEQANADLPPLKEFILPGGSPNLAQAHVVRVTIRRAERTLWELVEMEGEGTMPVAVYLNRLSDALFILARLLGQWEHSVVYWRKPAKPTA